MAALVRKHRQSGHGVLGQRHMATTPRLRRPLRTSSNAATPVAAPASCPVRGGHTARERERAATWRGNAKSSKPVGLGVCREAVASDHWLGCRSPLIRCRTPRSHGAMGQRYRAAGGQYLRSAAGFGRNRPDTRQRDSNQVQLLDAMALKQDCHKRDQCDIQASALLVAARPKE